MRLDEQVATRDTEVFVARERELDLLTTLLQDDTHRVGLVTGPAGCGKSALVREIARRAARTGVPLVTVDEPDLDEAGLRTRLAAASGETRVVVAARRRPGPGWWRSGWDASMLEVRLAPLDPTAARALLVARGVPGSDDLAAVVAWADGLPLSLGLAAAARATAGRPLGTADLVAVESDVLDHLTDGLLVGADVLGADRLVLVVASLAPGVDAGLVEAVLPGRAGEEAERWLRDLPFAERHGHRVTLEPRVRRLVAAHLRRSEPDLERTLRLRIIDHLADAAQEGRPHLVVDMREVLGPRAGAGPVAWQVDTASPADLPALRELLSVDDPAYVEWVCRWVEDAPDHVLVVRHPHPAPGQHGLAALALWATSEVLPAAADPHLADWIVRSGDWEPGGPTLLNPVTEVFVDPEAHPEVGGLILNAVVQRCGLSNFRRWVAPRKDAAPDPAACGGVPAPDLDLRFGSTRVEAFVIDYGPAGVIPALQAQAHAELARSTTAEPAGDGIDVLREALRAFHDPLVLATSPLASGADPSTRAESVRMRVRAAIDAAFGAGPAAELQREVLLRGYVDTDAGHARAMRALHLSRTTYFRRLREATATVGAWLEASPDDRPTVVQRQAE